MLTLFIIILSVLVILVIAIGLQPAGFTVARSATMAAPAAAVFGQVNDFRKWADWSPYEKLDPTMHRTYDGPPAGAGASMTWSGNRHAGAGRVTITASRPGERIDIRLEMFKPFAADNPVEFAFRSESGGTVVTWRMSGRKNFATKALHLVLSMDRMLGGNMEEGLAKLKTVAEAAARR